MVFGLREKNSRGIALELPHKINVPFLNRLRIN